MCQVHKALLAWLEDAGDCLLAPAAGSERTPEALGLRPLPQYSSLEEAKQVRLPSQCAAALQM